MDRETQAGSPSDRKVRGAVSAVQDMIDDETTDREAGGVLISTASWFALALAWHATRLLSETTTTRT